MPFDPKAYLENKPQAPQSSFDPRAYLENKEQPAPPPKTGGLTDKTKRQISNWVVHPLATGAAMTAGGVIGGGLAAAGTGGIGAIPGVVAGSVAAYPVGKQAAIGIDRMMGLETRADPQTVKEAVIQQGNDLLEGAIAEAGGRLVGPALNAAKKVLPTARVGEWVSGTPASNLKRAYDQGFKKTYVDPMPLDEAGAQFGREKSRVLTQHLTPEEQAAMAINPRGEAQDRLADVMTRWLKGENISAKDAVAAKEAITSVFPPDVARNAMQRGKLSQFSDEMNQVLAKADPAFKQANDDFAASKLRSQLTKVARVNKNNPDQYSKLALSTMAAPLGGLAAYLRDPQILLGALLATGMTSPLAMGLASSLSGTAARAGGKTVGRALRSPLGSRAASSALGQMFAGE